MDRPWSPSAVRAYRECPRKWRELYAESDPAKRSARPGATAEHLRLGTAAHKPLEVAYRMAAVEPDFWPNSTMGRYAELALAALESEWLRLALPLGGTSYDQVAAEIDRCLTVLPCPHPRAVLAVEQVVPAVGPYGRAFTNTLDLALRTGRSSIHIRDWKRRAVKSLGKPTDLLDDPQLCSYRVAAAQRWPWVRAATVGLYSIPAAREIVAELPLEHALEVLAGNEVTAYRAESDEVCAPTPQTGECGSCRVRSTCPEWTN